MGLLNFQSINLIQCCDKHSLTFLSLWHSAPIFLKIYSFYSNYEMSIKFNKLPLRIFIYTIALTVLSTKCNCQIPRADMQPQIHSVSGNFIFCFHRQQTTMKQLNICLIGFIFSSLTISHKYWLIASNGCIPSHLCPLFSKLVHFYLSSLTELFLLLI